MYKLIPYDRHEIKGSYAKTKNFKILEEFRDSEYDCVKVEGWTNTTAHNAANTLNVSIKRFGLGGIKALSRAGNVYLIKTT